MYNHKLQRSRRVVKNVFDVLKATPSMRILGKIEVNVKHLHDLTIVCVIQHNVLLDHRDDDYASGEVE